MTVTRKKPLNTIMLLGATTVLVAIIIATWVMRSSTTTFDVSSNDSGNVGAIHVSEDAELRNLTATFIELGERLDSMDRRIQLLTDSMPSPVSRLSSIDQQQPSAIDEESAIEMIQMIEPAAAVTSDTLTIASTGADKSAAEGTADLAAWLYFPQ